MGPFGLFLIPLQNIKEIKELITKNRTEDCHRRGKLYEKLNKESGTFSSRNID